MMATGAGEGGTGRHRAVVFCHASAGCTMSGYDGPSPEDVRRCRRARLVAQAEVAAARGVYKAARRAAFRRELGSTVRCASPVLVALLAREALDVSDVVARIEPPAKWPRLSRAIRTGLHEAGDVHAFRYERNMVLSGFRQAGADHGILVPLDNGGSALVRVLVHSVEVRLDLEDFVFDTQFGELRITTRKPLPFTVAADLVDRSVDAIFSHPASDGWGWRIRSAETIRGVTMCRVPTGVVPWRIA